MIFKEPLVLFAKGGSGGGGSSGKVDFPDYMKTWHGVGLDNDAADSLTYSITDAMNDAYGNSPYSGESAYNPSSEIADIVSAVDAFNSSIGTIISDAEINDEVAAYRDIRDDELVNIVLPRFKGGMRDVNAVMTSAFVIGGAIIEAHSSRDVAKFDADLRLTLQKLEVQMRERLLHYSIDANRIMIVAKKEQADRDLEIDAKDAEWDLKTFQYGANFLGSISGSAVSTGDLDTKGSALGGALSGAAAGALAGSQIMPGWGTAIGAGIGGLLGAFG